MRKMGNQETIRPSRLFLAALRRRYLSFPRMSAQSMSAGQMMAGWSCKAVRVSWGVLHPLAWGRLHVLHGLLLRCVTHAFLHCHSALRLIIWRPFFGRSRRYLVVVLVDGICYITIFSSHGSEDAIGSAKIRPAPTRGALRSVG